jgi:hypothetical protein
MSAPERSPPERYFVDYEIWSGGQAVAWGQLVQASTSLAHATDDNALVDAIRQRAGGRHGVTPGEVRIRMLARLRITPSAQADDTF